MNLGALQDTVPVDRVVSLKSTFPKRFGGELIMRLTYKEYVEDEEEDGTEDRPYLSGNPMGGKMPDMVEELAELARFWNEEAQKAQEMFLNSNYSSGSDRKDDWFPRGMAEDSGRGGNKDGTLSGYSQQLQRMAQSEWHLPLSSPCCIRRCSVQSMHAVTCVVIVGLQILC